MTNIKNRIQTDYTSIALTAEKLSTAQQREQVCSGIYNPIKDKYSTFDGYIDEANLGLGCGFPFEYIQLAKNNVVVDLGCASGIDTFIVNHRLNQTGKAIGIDITQKLIDRAKHIANKHKLKNVAFICADIETIPLKTNTADFIISNGVFSLVPDLKSTFSESYRILKQDGEFCFSDIVIMKTYTDSELEKIKKYTGCLNGIYQYETYVHLLKKVGFTFVETLNLRKVELYIDELKNESEVYIATIKAKKYE